MVAAKNEEIFRVFDLVGQQKADCLKRLLSTINVVAEEEIVCFGWESTVLEKAKQIVVLPMNVA